MIVLMGGSSIGIAQITWWRAQIFDAIRHRLPEAKTASLFWRHTAHSAADLKSSSARVTGPVAKRHSALYRTTELHGRLHGELGNFPFPFSEAFVGLEVHRLDSQDDREDHSRIGDPH